MAALRPHCSCWRTGAAAPRRRALAVHAAAQATPVMKSGMQGQVDEGYLAAANFLKSIGFTNTAEIARVLDVAMNPNSLFFDLTSKRSGNANARPLTVQADLQPVVEFLRNTGMDSQAVVTVITAHPPVLCYSVEARLGPFWDYLASIGVPDVSAAVVKRPSLLGLDVDANLRKIVDYLTYVGTPAEDIIKYITTSI